MVGALNAKSLRTLKIMTCKAFFKKKKMKEKRKRDMGKEEKRMSPMLTPF